VTDPTERPIMMTRDEPLSPLQASANALHEG
jgi:hypothetical protein